MVYAYTRFMEYTNLHVSESQHVPGVWWTVHQVHQDERGSFTEAAVNTFLEDMGADPIKQVNVSISNKRVLRGMHIHEKQWDAWYVVSGIAQVAVEDKEDGELRTLYPAHGVVIPPGVAHGFLAVEDLVLVYAVSHEYFSGPDEFEYNASSVKGWLIDPEECERSKRDRQAVPRGLLATEKEGHKNPF